MTTPVEPTPPATQAKPVKSQRDHILSMLERQVLIRDIAIVLLVVSDVLYMHGVFTH